MGQEVRRTYHVVLPGEKREIRCQTPGAAWDAKDNLVAVTRYYTNGPALNRVKSVQRPDGTMTFFEYAYSSRGDETNTVTEGEPNRAKNAIVDGTRTVTVRGALGQMLMRTSVDVASGATLSREIHSNYDVFERPQRVTYLDGTHTETQYACCGIDNTTDRDGVLTQYWYDASKRRVASTRSAGSRFAITTTNVLDAAGHVLRSIRIGDDGSRLPLRQAAYDLAGRVTAETNALGGVTRYSERRNNLGQSVRTATYPDDGTRIEQRYLDGSVEQVSGSAVSPVRYVHGVANVDGFPRAYTAEVRLTSAGTETKETSTNYFDLLGRNYKTAYAAAGAPYPSRQSFYNLLGQKIREVDPDGVTSLHQYNGRGERECSVVDMDRDGQVDLAGSDRVTRSVSSVGWSVCASEIKVRRTLRYVWAGDGDATPLCLSTNEVSLDGLRSWSITQAGTNHSQTVYGTDGYRYVTNTAPDGSFTTSVYRDGRLESVVRRDGSAARAVVSSTSYGYDPHGRRNSITDGRTGTTLIGYNDADRVATNTTPAPGPGQSAQRTITLYDKSLRAWKVIQPDNTSVISEFYPNGLLKKTYGSRTYPVGYTYDYAGRMKTMTTWRNAKDDSTAAVTTWNYDAYRGWLESKRYADPETGAAGGAGPDYAYYTSGRLKERTWARGTPRLKTTYSYNNAGELSGVDYGDDTASLLYGYDRRGRQTRVTQGKSVTTRAYDDAGNLLGEAYSKGALDGLVVSNRYGAFLRRTNLALVDASGGLLASTGYGYDSASRLKTVSDSTNTATYSYLEKSPLVEQIDFASNGEVRMTTTKQYDNINRLRRIASVAGAETVASFTYTYNDANQRTVATLGDGSYWEYTYDALGQVTSGKKYWSDGTAVAGQQFEYSFDDIGNRKAAGTGGGPDNTPMRYSSYSANALNQYASRTVPGFVSTLGEANTNARVTLWGDNGSYSVATRKGEYFHAELAVNNSTGAVWLTLTNLGVVRDNGGSVADGVVGRAFVPATPEAFGYDLDGNLTNDGRWVYTWDAENRLVGMWSAARVGPQQSLRFEYDWQGRRIRKQVWDNAHGKGNPTNEVRFAYDRWNLIAEMEAAGRRASSFTWGLDLSGSLRGAGGVGGLLAVKGASADVCFVAYDGNGNVGTLVRGWGVGGRSQREYGPFGEVICTTGMVSSPDSFRFSTKYQDSETDLVYYGFRYLASCGVHWLSRDPIHERADQNLYRFAKNNPIVTCDRLGRDNFTYDGTTVRITPTVTPSDPCAGGSIAFRVHFWVNNDDQGANYLTNASFSFGGSSSVPSDFQDYPMQWDCLYSLATQTMCRPGSLGGSLTFTASYSGLETPPLSIDFQWSYSCDCLCRTADFTSSWEFRASAPLYPD